MSLLERIAEHLAQLPPHFRKSTGAQLLAIAAIELQEKRQSSDAEEPTTP